MDVLELTHMSYCWTAIAVLSGIAAAALFFAYDIRRCWRIVRGKQPSALPARSPARKKKIYMEKTLRHSRTQKLTQEERKELPNPGACKSTVLLTPEEIKPLETMHLVQDITMIEAQLQ